jgi:hypothetical protein
MMMRVFRDPDPGVSAYAALMLFAVVYLAAMAFVVAPNATLTWVSLGDASPEPRQPTKEK